MEKLHDSVFELSLTNELQILGMIKSNNSFIRLFVGNAIDDDGDDDVHYSNRVFDRQPTCVSCGFD